MHIKLDKISEWRVNQIALSEGRSHTNACAEMIRESWDHRMKAATSRALCRVVNGGGLFFSDYQQRPPPTLVVVLPFHFSPAF